MFVQARKVRSIPPEPANVLEEVRQSLVRRGITSSDLLVVGLSGGVDSQTLTHALATLRDSENGPSVHAVHVDHQLRLESGEDAAAAYRFARSLSVPIDVARVDVGNWDRRLGRGVEAAARMARYAALATAARRLATRYIAVGHSLDDQVETMLLRWARGTSLDGLVGMRELSGRAVPLQPTGLPSFDVLLIRPLLHLRRAVIEEYARSHGLTAVEDRTNLDFKYRRNAVRHQIIPLLERVLPGAVASFERAARLLSDDADFLSAAAEDAFAGAARRVGPCVQVSRSAFRELSAPMQRRVIVRTVYSISADVELSSERVEALRAAMLDGAVSSVIEVGHGIRALVDYDSLCFGPNEQIETTLRAESDQPLLERDTVAGIAGTTTIRLGNDWTLTAECSEGVGDWELRTRRPGDRLRIGQGRHHRLQDWFVNQKVSGYLRDYTPLLVHAGEVRWVARISMPLFKDVDSGLEARITHHSMEDQQNVKYAAGDPSPRRSGTDSH